MFMACSEDQDGLVRLRGPFNSETEANDHARKMVQNVLRENPKWTLVNDDPDPAGPHNFSELTDLAEMDFTDDEGNPCHRIFVLRVRAPADDDE